MLEEKKLKLYERQDVDILSEHMSINSRDARMNFSRVVNAARIEKETVVITDHGQPAAAVVPLADLRILDKLRQLTLGISEADFKEMTINQFRDFIQRSEHQRQPQEIQSSRNPDKEPR